MSLLSLIKQQEQSYPVANERGVVRAVSWQVEGLFCGVIFALHAQHHLSVAAKAVWGYDHHSSCCCIA